LQAGAARATSTPLVVCVQTTESAAAKSPSKVRATNYTLFTLTLEGKEGKTGPAGATGRGQPNRRDRPGAGTNWTDR
jgi:hypothetical protein